MLAKKFPNANQVERSYEVLQETGDVIFVPSGWHHQVHNLEDTISINHNWFNGANIGNIFGDLKKGIAVCLASIKFLPRRLRESHAASRTRCLSTFKPPGRARASRILSLRNLLYTKEYR